MPLTRHTTLPHCVRSLPPRLWLHIRRRCRMPRRTPSRLQRHQVCPSTAMELRSLRARCNKGQETLSLLRWQLRSRLRCRPPSRATRDATTTLAAQRMLRPARNALAHWRQLRIRMTVHFNLHWPERCRLRRPFAWRMQPRLQLCPIQPLQPQRHTRPMRVKVELHHRIRCRIQRRSR
jgi:hypothetical protein